MSNFEKVREFMLAMEQEVKSEADWPSDKIILLRRKLIEEEFEEYDLAIEAEDLVAVADALTDLLYVIYGAGLAFGIDLDRCFAEVHRSNMTKLGADGKPIRNEFGKIMKGPNYTPPDLSFVVNDNPPKPII